jgi:hypothetical protein
MGSKYEIGLNWNKKMYITIFFYNFIYLSFFMINRKYTFYNYILINLSTYSPIHNQQIYRFISYIYQLIINLIYINIIIILIKFIHIYFYISLILIKHYSSLINFNNPIFHKLI